MFVGTIHAYCFPIPQDDPMLSDVVNLRSAKSFSRDFILPSRHVLLSFPRQLNSSRVFLLRWQERRAVADDKPTATTNTKRDQPRSPISELLTKTVSSTQRIVENYSAALERSGPKR
jgi:hypothetical protein